MCLHDNKLFSSTIDLIQFKQSQTFWVKLKINDLITTIEARQSSIQLSNCCRIMSRNLWVGCNHHDDVTDPPPSLHDGCRWSWGSQSPLQLTALLWQLGHLHLLWMQLSGKWKVGPFSLFNVCVMSNCLGTEECSASPGSLTISPRGSPTRAWWWTSGTASAWPCYWTRSCSTGPGPQCSGLTSALWRSMWIMLTR